MRAGSRSDILKITDCYKYSNKNKRLSIEIVKTSAHIEINGYRWKC